MSEDNSIPSEWYFITPPQQVKWEKSSKSRLIDTYGTNNPYLNYGSTHLRKLTLGDALVEGFSDGKSVEGNITALENCMRMVLDVGTGFTAPYCWEVFAGEKSYGTYIIDSIDVEEQMRDLSGAATRARVSITLQEVNPYQVTSGTDITSTAVTGGITPESEAALAAQDEKVANSKSAAPTNSTGQPTDASSSDSDGGGAAAGPEVQTARPSVDL